MIIGKLKCGTTSLYRYLTEHPCILPALVKETHFFDVHYERGLEWYRAQFPPIGDRPKLITGEASATYIDSTLAAARIHERLPATRFIVLMRDPVQRTISHYYMNVRIGLETAPIEEATLAGLGPDRDASRPNIYVQCSMYYQSLKAWLALFPREQFLFVASEELFARPAEVTNRVYAFLGQEPFFSDGYGIENEGRYPPADPALQRKLREYFAPHNAALERFLGARFDWDG